ncbi:hypothetical protein LJ114_06980 [Propionibacterium freudenreichii]|uniref:hypothetical protein n=1 Tax=Propionibacterium freudenreichii TaxID=1744 RepID=UPI0012FDC4A3|nr:hypothetical protein [Propionibacterium freudenreichii]WBF58738.1 hypothetical protein LJ113_05840 [Propionibacterium freudenreichii]WBF61087.1 hypothetical protein LJ114_06980 [Propionibacterium freudenreichii]WBF64790.1 hypothetical protein LJ112_04355 [Propionibacterium freudenreichii]
MSRRVARSAAEGIGDSVPATEPICTQVSFWSSSWRAGTIARRASAVGRPHK